MANLPHGSLESFSDSIRTMTEVIDSFASLAVRFISIRCLTQTCEEIETCMSKVPHDACLVTKMTREMALPVLLAVFLDG